MAAASPVLYYTLTFAFFVYPYGTFRGEVSCALPFSLRKTLSQYMRRQLMVLQHCMEASLGSEWFGIATHCMPGESIIHKAWGWDEHS